MSEILLNSIIVIIGTLLILGLLIIIFGYFLYKKIIPCAEKLSHKIQFKERKRLKLLYLLESAFHVVLLILISLITYIQINQEYMISLYSLISGLFIIITFYLMVFLGVLFAGLVQKYSHEGYTFKFIKKVSTTKFLKCIKRKNSIKWLLEKLRLLYYDHLFIILWISTIYLLLTFLIILKWPEEYYLHVSSIFFLLMPIFSSIYVYFLPSNKEANRLDIIELRRMIVYAIFVGFMIWDAQRRYLNLSTFNFYDEDKVYDVLVYMMTVVYLALDRLFKIIIDDYQKMRA